MDDPDLARGLAHLRAREWFEAHEALEAAWGRAAGPRRTALQGLVHAAVALVHLRRGNQAGARLQLAKARRRAARLDGFDPAPWLDALDVLVSSAGAPPPPPEAWPTP